MPLTLERKKLRISHCDMLLGRYALAMRCPTAEHPTHILPIHLRTRFRTSSRGIVMPRGASPKREREYNELKGEFKREGRYKGREEEVAARIVNKQRAQAGETKSSTSSSRDNRSRSS